MKTITVILQGEGVPSDDYFNRILKPAFLRALKENTMTNNPQAQTGKYKGYGLVFDKNGKLKVDDYEKLSPTMKKIVDDYRREHEPPEDK